MSYLHRFTTLTACFSLAANAAFAWPAQTTADLNMRQGPTTGAPVMTTLPQGTSIEVEECDDAAAWCAVTVDGKTGFVSGKYLTEADEPNKWPRTFSNDKGASVTLYQPQVNDWKNFTKMTALVATQVKRSKDAEPLYGIITISADTVADRENNEIIATNIVITDLSFSNLTRDDMDALALGVGKQLPTGEITLSLPRTTASLENFQSFTDLKDLDTTPPLIYVSEKPSILVMTDGEPLTATVDGVPDLAFTVNTNWDLFSIYDSGKWTLRNNTSWLEAEDLSGPWTDVATLPEIFTTLPDDGNWDDARRAVAEGLTPSDPLPEVFYSNVPTELITMDGPPNKEPVSGTKLEWVSNTQFDLFYHTVEAQWYFLTSGRWFRNKDLNGDDWTFASGDLPEDFRNIPDDAPYYAVRSSVPGTPESEEARLLASIPEIAAVDHASVKADVSYAGDPEFTPIKGTEMSYALNSNETVLKVGDVYYTVIDGIWFKGDSPQGPFEVATSVPDVIYTIPATEPVHNVTYVTVVDSTPTTTYFGVTAGYFFGYYAWGSIFYGPGWNYPPYWSGPGYRPPGFRPPFIRPPGYRPPGFRPPHVRPPIAVRPPAFYPRPVTYGIGGYYDPKRGQFGRYGDNYGPDRGLPNAPKIINKDGNFVRNQHITPKAQPLGASRPFVSATNPRLSTAQLGSAAASVGAGRAFNSWKGNSGVLKGSPAAHQLADNRLGALAGNKVNGTQDLKWAAGAKDAVLSNGKAGDLFAGKDGGVYRQNNGKWERNDGGGKWQGVQQPKALPQINRPAQLPAAGTTRPAQLPATGINRPTQLPANVGSAYQNRQTGNQRQIQNRNIQRPSGGIQSRPSGGGRMGGGGGRMGGGRR
ncbi:SH3 domain-containing protein [Falsihalocynthiibacter sp. BN13B15]|uniref:SH3 domain-containing protein n=1 Tax=Falsihalocynthiibacter sp. BN13B15 TaxID=3240871 RepID=UPI00350FB3F0